jgi:hypothetical protein
MDLPILNSKNPILSKLLVVETPRAQNLTLHKPHSLLNLNHKTNSQDSSETEFSPSRFKLE